VSGFHDALKAGVFVDEADFVVVGSGAGGGAAARALARGGASVVVLEEGPLAETASLGVVARESMSRLFRHGGKMAAFGRATLPILQGRCVGGTTFVNSAIIWRLPDKIVADWVKRFGLSATVDAAALERVYRVIEDEMSVRAVEEGVTSGRQDLLLRDAAAQVGIAGRFMHRSEFGCRGSGRCLHGCPHEAKQSTAVNHLRRAVADGANVFANAEVRRVLIERGRAVGVQGRGFQIKARRAVVVAASAIQSPNLLHRSGVRHPHLGHHFMAHPGTTIMALYPDRVGAWSGASQGYEAIGLRDELGIKVESINVPPEIAAARMPGAGKRLSSYLDRLDHLAVWALAIRADSEGRVRPSLMFGDRVDYQVSSNDLGRLRKGLKRVGEMHFVAGAKEIIPGVFGLPEVMTSPDQLHLFDDAPLDPRAYSMVATHLFGGCRAGIDPATSVVNAHLRVHDVQSLYVMDASVFPTNTGVNPQHSIMALSTVAAERLLT